jgi:hypothetical protein
MRFVTKPLPAVWPGGSRTPADERRTGPFKATVATTMDLLEYELVMLGAREPITLEAGFQAHEIRLDGQPRMGAQPRDPGLIVSFEGRYGPLRYACDRYVTYGRNLRAIALTLQALRAVDRYGATQRGEQYQGWAALPAVGGTGMTTVEAEAFIRDHANGAVGPDQDLRAAYRAAAKRLYPQLPGADRAPWDQLLRAKEALGL